MPNGSLPQWFTTEDAARALERSTSWVRRLARTRQLASERTVAGQWLFRAEDVRRLADKRTAARLAGVRVLRPKMLRVDGEPRQLPLLDRSLRLVAKVPDPELKTA